MINWREKFVAFAIHFGVTATLGACAAALIFLVWFPRPFATMIGGTELFLLVVGCDLALGPLEAAHLLKGAGTEVDEAALHDLLQRTEGWPTGLYIAALAMNSGTRHSDVGFTFTGDDVYMGDYLRSELLDRISDEEASFLTRTSGPGPRCG